VYSTKNSNPEQTDRIEGVIKPGLVALKTALIKEQITVDGALFPTFYIPVSRIQLRLEQSIVRLSSTLGPKQTTLRYHSIRLASSLHNARDFISALPISHVEFI
jgi:hypothetical protein